MKKTTTARGKSIDMSSIAKKYEKTRAVSNVPINAKGDIIDNRNNVVKTREQVKQEYYKDTVVGATKQVAIKDDENKEPAPVVVENKLKEVEKPVEAKPRTVKQKPVEEMTPSEALDELAKQSQEVSRTKRTRKDGSEYYEVEYEDGSMEEENIVK